jgi:hypothetical protein
MAVLSVLKWLIWLFALGFLLLVLSAPLLVGGSLGPTEYIVSFFVVALMSVPGWIIHFIQQRKKAQSSVR